MRIIFYDGLCPMCNSWVRFIIRWDRKKHFHFAPLQGETARRILSPVFPAYLEEDTIILWEKNKPWLRSTAALRISMALAFPVSLLQVGWLMPGFLRDGIYRWVASRRYKFGKRYETCPLPPAEWRDRFL